MYNKNIKSSNKEMGDNTRKTYIYASMFMRQVLYLLSHLL